MSIVEDIFRRCTSGPNKGELTAQNVSLYHTSPYTIYCKKFVSEDKKDPRSPYRELLHERGQEHERYVIEKDYPECETIHYKEPEEGFLRLLTEMAEGANVICRMPMYFLPENMQGRIDVIEKRRDHPSVFGGYHYVVKEIKLSKNLKEEHLIQAAFYTYVIGKIQEYLPGKFFVINRDHEEQEYVYKDYEASLKEAIKGTQAILDGAQVPTPTYNGCEWPWQTFCNHQALKSRDVSLVGQVGFKTKANLAAYGFKKIWDISSADIEDLKKVPRIGAVTAKKLIGSAKAIKKRELIPLDKSALKFPERSTEIFLDLEGTDQQGHEGELGQVDYLIGILVRAGGEETYWPFIAYRMQDEGKMFEDFMAFIERQRDYVIYHWHNYERGHIKQLAERHGLTAQAETLLFPYMIDLHKVATKAFVFPTYGNGLKDIAAFLGFKWRHDDINALDAIAYYLKYQDDPDGYRDKMEAIVDYNEDDCIATRVIKDWLRESASVDAATPGMEVQVH